MAGRRSGPLLAGAVIAAVLAAIAAIVVITSAGTTEEPGPQAAPTAPESIVDTARSEPAEPSVLAQPPTQSATPSPALAPPVPPADVLAAAEQAAPPGMTLGLAVLDLSRGDLAEGRNGARLFISASLSKLIVVVDMLDRQRAEGRTIAEADLDLVRRALVRSDDGAMNLLWGKYDGPGAITRVAGRLGLPATRAPRDRSQWGDTQVNATEFVRIYQYIHNEMAAEDRAVIVDALAVAEPAGADGFDQHFGLLAQGASGQRYAKQAWVPYRPAGYLLHSAGVVHDARSGTDYAIALLSIQSSVSAQTARERLSAVAAAALDTLGATE